MTIRFEQTIDDTMAFYKHFIRTSETIKRSFVRMRWYLSAGALLAWMITQDPKFTAIMAAILLALVLLLPWYTRKIMEHRARQTYQKPDNARMMGWHTMELTDEGMVVTTDNATATYKWPVVLKTVHVPNYVFIYFSEMMAIVVPVSRLTPSEVEALNKTLETHIKQ